MTTLERAKTLRRLPRELLHMQDFEICMFRYLCLMHQVHLYKLKTEQPKQDVRERGKKMFENEITRYSRIRS
jgi:hypothetical protein